MFRPSRVFPRPFRHGGGGTSAEGQSVNGGGGTPEGDINLIVAVMLLILL